MDPVNVKPSIYNDFNKENNKEGPNFKVYDSIRISKQKKLLQESMFQIGLTKFL